MGDGVSHAEMLARLEQLEAKLRSRSDQRHAENEKLHQIIGTIDERLDQHADEIKELRGIAKSTSDSLAEIKSLLAGSLGQEGLAARMKSIEVWQADASRTLWIVQTVGGWIVAPLGTAIGGAVLWLVYQGQGK